MEGAKESQEKIVLWGDGFSMTDSFAQDFPRVAIDTIRRNILQTLKKMSERGYTGIEEELEFDADGLVVGTYRSDSIVGAIGLRAQVDIESFMERISEGQNFDTYFKFDRETRKARVGCVLKKHELVPHVYVFESRLKRV